MIRALFGCALILIALFAAVREERRRRPCPRCGDALARRCDVSCAAEDWVEWWECPTCHVILDPWDGP